MSTNPPPLDFKVKISQKNQFRHFFASKKGERITDVRHLSLFQREAAAVLRRERARAAAQGGRTKGQARRQLTPRAPPLQVCLLLTYILYDTDMSK